ncbi:MAG TPA: ATP-binding protein [Verrucomicrobiota bacterium]|nr:ATP-binding protein [Verrucomicrobiota bacterium]HNT14865.1 ATP-binding protein [Verrucomicrobiota bacterium]
MLRTRIFLHLIPFVLILIAVGGFALVLVSRLAASVSRTITENYQRDNAATQMTVTLDRMDTALQRSRTEEPATVREMFDDNARLFEAQLTAQSSNLTAQAEADLLQQLRTNFVALRFEGAQMFRPEVAAAEQHAIYDRQIIPKKLAIDVLLNRWREASKQNIFGIADTIKQTNRTIIGVLSLSLGGALLLLGYASYKLSRAILRPIQTLTNAAREIGAGNLAQTVPVLSADELGELAGTFNKMAAQLHTYRQSTTEQIVRLHRTMEAALASFSDPVFILDPQGRIELSNRAAEELSAQLGLHGALPPRLVTAVERVLAENQDFLPDSFEAVLTLRLADQERAFLPRLHIMREAEAQTIGVAVVLHDVTRFRLLDDAKTNLVGTVSHELKTPLTSVRMVLHMLHEKSVGPLTPAQAGLVETARKDSERLLRMLDALLDIARLEAGDSSLNREIVPARELVTGSLEEARTLITARGFQLLTRLPADLPAVLVDRQQIGHVFQNFIANAMKHSPPQGEILVAAQRLPDGQVRFSVTDRGPGVAPEHQARIFDRFFRVPGQAKTGAGLGLSIVREIIVAHGGRVGVQSVPGRGSEFFFVLEAADQRAVPSSSVAKGAAKRREA